MVLWTGLIADDSSVLYMTTSKNISPFGYADSFEQLSSHHYNTVIKNQTKREYELCCFINFDLYITPFSLKFGTIRQMKLM